MILIDINGRLTVVDIEFIDYDSCLIVPTKFSGMDISIEDIHNIVRLGNSNETFNLLNTSDYCNVQLLQLT